MNVPSGQPNQAGACREDHGQDLYSSHYHSAGSSRLDLLHVAGQIVSLHLIDRIGRQNISANAERPLIAAVV
ncbi:MAG: hypothetical protein AB7O56_13820 [Bauldia sp.]